MNREDQDILIHPRRGSREHALPARALLVANPAEARLATEEFAGLGAEKQFLYHSTLLVDWDREFCLAGPSLGAPAAGLVMEKLIALGVSEFYLFSCCGVINPGMSIGDVLLATSGVCGEGVSRYYGNHRVVRSGETATERMRQFLNLTGIEWRETTVWSTDAPYRESRAELAKLKKEFGVDAIDMEFTALCSIAAFRNVSLAALFIVSDELWGTKWKPGFTQPDYRERVKTLISALLASGLKENVDLI